MSKLVLVTEIKLWPFSLILTHSASLVNQLKSVLDWFDLKIIPGWFIPMFLQRWRWKTEKIRDLEMDDRKMGIFDTLPNWVCLHNFSYPDFKWEGLLNISYSPVRGALKIKIFQKVKTLTEPPLPPRPPPLGSVTWIFFSYKKCSVRPFPPSPLRHTVRSDLFSLSNFQYLYFSKIKWGSINWFGSMF